MSTATVSAAATVTGMQDHKEKDQSDEHFGHEKCQCANNQSANYSFYNNSCHLILLLVNDEIKLFYFFKGIHPNLEIKLCQSGAGSFKDS